MYYLLSGNRQTTALCWDWSVHTCMAWLYVHDNDNSNKDGVGYSISHSS